ncbi:MAG TPA: hypothetical protein VM869_26170 [Enhygromyxa sp.]|nr:hypothetical protein [Enhygromyxa sp.]
MRSASELSPSFTVAVGVALAWLCSCSVDNAPREEAPTSDTESTGDGDGEPGDGDGEPGDGDGDGEQTCCEQCEAMIADCYAVCSAEYDACVSDCPPVGPDERDVCEGLCSVDYEDCSEPCYPCALDCPGEC